MPSKSLISLSPSRLRKACDWNWLILLRIGSLAREAMGRLYGLYRGMPLWAQHAAVSLLQSTERRRDLGSRLGKRVREIYSARRAIEQVCGNCDSVLRAKTRAAA